jgi:hypothetical protein
MGQQYIPYFQGSRRSLALGMCRFRKFYTYHRFPRCLRNGHNHLKCNSCHPRLCMNASGISRTFQTFIDSEFPLGKHLWYNSYHQRLDESSRHISCIRTQRLEFQLIDHMLLLGKTFLPYLDRSMHHKFGRYHSSKWFNVIHKYQRYTSYSPHPALYSPGKWNMFHRFSKFK